MERRRIPILDTALGVAAAMGGMSIGGARLERPLPEPEPRIDRHYPPKVEAKLAYHRTGHKHNREERAERRAVSAEEQSRINKMTNWQRSQWARAGYPKGRIEEFVALVRSN